MGLCSSASADAGVAAPLEPEALDAEVEASAPTTDKEAAAASSSSSSSSSSLVDLGLADDVHDDLSLAEKKQLQSVLAPVYGHPSATGAGISSMELGRVLVLDGETVPEGSAYHNANVPVFVDRLHAALCASASSGSSSSSSSKALHITSLVRGLKDISNTHATAEQQAAWLYKSVYSGTPTATGDENGEAGGGVRVKDLVPIAMSFLNTTASAALAGARGVKHFEGDVRRVGLSGGPVGGDLDPLVQEAVLEWCCESMMGQGGVAMNENSPVSEEMFRLWVEDMKAT